MWSNVTNRDYPLPDYSDIHNWLISWEDLAQIAVWAVIFTLARVYIQKYFKGVAHYFEVAEEDKFSESCWKVIYYVIAWTTGLVLAYRLNIFPLTKNCWENWPLIPVEPETRIWYLFQLGFYFHSFYAHFAYEVKRSDFWPLLFHHAVTIWLIYFSFVTDFHRIGILVLLCHDINDITFEIGKTFVYYKKNKIAINITFVLIMANWVITRLGIYPFMVVWSTSVESLEYVPKDLFPFYWGFNGCLSFLVCLHVYWFGLMLRMAYRIITGKEKEVVDTRETDQERDSRIKNAKKHS